MAVDPQLTEAQVRALASTESFARGREYQDEGAVVRLSRRGDQLLAEVEGSDYAPYEVTVTLDAGGIVGYDCTCPYDWGGACKHIVASLLATIEEPEEVEQRPALDTLLAGLSADQLRGILTTLAKERPTLADVVESQVLLLQHAPAAPPAAGEPETAAAGAHLRSTRERQTPLDPQPFQRQVRAAFASAGRMRSSDDYWHAGSVLASVRQVAQQARPYSEAGDGRTALVILTAVTTEYLDEWTEMDVSDDMYGAFFDELGDLWTEALLNADLSAAERRTWVEQFAAWREELADYSVDEGFAMAEAAAQQGWDDPALQRVLQGESPAPGAGDGAPPPYADELTVARLRVLERQGRTQEYLNLAEAAGQMALYHAMLVKLGRVAEAIESGLQHLATAEAALAVAQALRGAGALPEALRLAEHGLTLPGRHVPLARWLRDLASGAGQPDRALPAAQAVLAEEPSLADYEALQALAGECWPALREEQFAALRQRRSYNPQAQVDIFLHEGLIDDAIASVDATTAAPLLDAVIEAAIATRPAWVIALCERLAGQIIEEGRAKHCSEAAHWLEQARAAAVGSGQIAAWRERLQSLLARHRRKYSLVPLLEALLKGSNT